MSEEEDSWFAVRCIFAGGWPVQPVGTAYEERVTLWRASTLDEAIARAEVEARDNATSISDNPDTYLGLVQACRLVEEPGHGAEVFSLIRRSDLPPEEYLDAIFDTGEEFQSDSSTGGESWRDVPGSGGATS